MTDKTIQVIAQLKLIAEHEATQHEKELADLADAEIEEVKANCAAENNYKGE